MGDIGSHLLDLAQHVAGDPIVGVCAVLGRIHDTRSRPSAAVETFARAAADELEPVAIGTEDFATVLVRFASGCAGVFTVSQVTAGRKNRLLLEIDARHSSFAWDQEEPNRLWIGRRNGPNAELLRDPTLLAPEAAPLAHYPAGHQEGWPDALKNLLADFYAAVVAQREDEPYEPSFASFADAHRTMQLVEAILESDRAGGWVEVGGHGEVAR